jgi:hypothetical protein
VLDVAVLDVAVLEALDVLGDGGSGVAPAAVGVAAVAAVVVAVAAGVDAEVACWTAVRADRAGACAGAGVRAIRRGPVPVGRALRLVKGPSDSRSRALGSRPVAGTRGAAAPARVAGRTEWA